MRSCFAICVLLAIPLVLKAQPIRGADLSFTQQIEDLGGTYTFDAQQMDALDIFKVNGCNFVRLRIWHTPRPNGVLDPDGYSGLGKTLLYAQRTKAKGMGFLLDFHYSDWWADPGKQNKPAAWASLTFAQLKDSVYAYTREVLEAFKAQGTVPDMVQIGNEITPGMLWNDGRVGGEYENPTQWQQFGELLKAGIQGAHDGAQDTSMRIMIHIDRGGNNSASRWFYDNLKAQSVPFDIIGLSYYPWWHGSLAQMTANVNDLAVRYLKDIILVETAYPWTTQFLNDGHGNIGVDPTQLPDGYPISPAGQKSFIMAIRDILQQVPNGRGLGFFYWEPAYISVSPIGSAWEHLTTFDFSGNALSSMGMFIDTDTLKVITVTMRFNTSTLGDTLRPSGMMQLRGEVKGVGSNILPDGKLISWGEDTQIRPVNIGGDYWETTFQMFEGDRIEFKIWAGHSILKPVALRIGWEGPITPFNGELLNARVFIAGSHDTVATWQYYNWSQSTVGQMDTPFGLKQDTIGVLFRVNMARQMAAGQFDPAADGPVYVQFPAPFFGDPVWGTDKVVMSRETTSVGGGSFWTGIGWLPTAAVTAGTELTYRFGVQSGSSAGLEALPVDRRIVVPARDSTLFWRFFNDPTGVTSVRSQEPNVPAAIQLEQNFPNPFNPRTSLRYGAKAGVPLEIMVVNILGQHVRTLRSGVGSGQAETISWDGTDAAGRQVSSGVYTIILSTGDGMRLARRAVLLR